jgi:endonuclease III
MHQSVELSMLFRGPARRRGSEDRPPKQCLNSRTHDQPKDDIVDRGEFVLALSASRERPEKMPAWGMISRRSRAAPAPAGALFAARDKLPFDLDEVLKRIEVAIRPFPKAALFELAEEGHASVFEQLVACIISTRTRDETTIAVARRLFKAAPTPEAVSRLGPAGLDALIDACTFHEPKAHQIHAIACRAVELGGSLPCDPALLEGFHGVGPKCASLVLGIACGEPRISVDVHVHRITNRWGYVQTRTPEKTMKALEGQVPRERWIDVNRLLVPFGKHICTGERPRCSTCPALSFCRQVGVDDHR